MPDVAPKQPSGAKRAVGETRALVQHYAALGLGPSEIGRLLGISRQSAAEHIRSLRDTGELPQDQKAAV